MNPKIDFTMFVISMATSAQVHMGFMEDPQTKQKTKNLPLAQQTIDIISLLSEKTKGNLSEEENKILEQVLYNLRLQFVEANK